MTTMVAFHEAVRCSLADAAEDAGTIAGETFMELAHQRGIDLPPSVRQYTSAICHAAAADVIVTAIRQTNNEVWSPGPDPVGSWISSAQMDPAGRRLRRFLAVSGWGDDREAYERQSWYCLGEVAHYEMPMQLVVAVIGPMSGGRRHNAWSKALLHPQGSELRFRLRRRSRVDGFAETWRPIYRYEHDEISRTKWIGSMALDEVLGELLFVREIPVPEPEEAAAIREIAKRQLENLSKIRWTPPKQLTTCLNPIHPCPFRSCCWGKPETKPTFDGYDARPALQLKRSVPGESIRNSSGSSFSPAGADGGNDAS